MKFGTSSIDDQLWKLRREAEEKETEELAAKVGLPYINLETSSIEIEALKLIPEDEARAEHVAAFKKRGDELFVAAYAPDEKKAQWIIKFAEGYKMLGQIYVVSRTSLERAWKEYKYVTHHEEPLTGILSIDAQHLERLQTIMNVHTEISNFDLVHVPAVEVLKIILSGAIATGASDVHLEVEEHDARVRFRLDGRLHDVTKIPKHIHERVLARLKLLAEIKLNIETSAQDGRFSVDLKGKSKIIEIRASIIPSEFGETVVLRVLDPDTIKLKLIDLGLRADDLAIIEEEIREPNGMILNTGPTGSGKTTTLYTFLQTIQDPELSIITIEDPIEYHIEGLEQTQVHPESGYTFASGLRSIMRQDPDVILVGEIRDKETAEISIQASLTGHLVFSTVHANSASGAIPRLIDLGVKAQSIGPALNLIIAQRLVRKLCLSCREEMQMSDDLQKKRERLIASLPKRVSRTEYEIAKVFRIHNGGCDQCNHTGYKGRVGIFELLRIDDTLETMITKDVTDSVVHHYAVEKQGMVTMQQDGLLKVFQGITTFEEVESVTGHNE